MHLNTTTSNNFGHYVDGPYLPVAPKYFVPGSYTTKDAYYVNPILDGPKDSSLDPGLEQLMQLKGVIIDSKIQMVISEIYQRRKLQYENLYNICLDQCACKTLVFSFGDHLWDNKRLALEGKIIDLEQEKRKEQTGYFRDILFLKKELRETLIEKLEGEQKADLLKT